MESYVWSDSLEEFIQKVEYAEHDFEKEYGSLSLSEWAILNRMKARDAAKAARQIQRQKAA